VNYVGIAGCNKADVRISQVYVGGGESHLTLPGRERAAGHCALQKLLRSPNLLVVDQHRLERLLAEAEGRLQELTSIQN